MIHKITIIKILIVRHSKESLYLVIFQLSIWPVELL